MKTHVIRSVIIIFLSLALFNIHVRAASIGISPAEISFDNVLKGGYAASSVTVSTSSETPIEFHVSATGAIKDWIEFETPDDMTISNGNMKRVTVIVRPPSNTANGVYFGNIVVSTDPSQTGGEGVGVGVTTGTTSDISITVTGDQIKDARVESISAKNTEEGNPVEFSVSVTNNGNVIATPLIKIDIMNKGEQEIIKTITHSQTDVLPTKMKIIRINVDSNDLEMGDYEALVTVSMDGKELSQRTVYFSILERGTLSKMGILQKIWNEPWVNVGDLVKIDAYFENTGEMIFTSKFKAEVYLEKKLIELVESEELEVSVGQTVVMSSYFRPKSPGKYIVSGHVIYSGKTTETKESYINVNPEGEPVPRQYAMPEIDYLPFLLLTLVIVVIVIYVMWRKRR